MRKVAVVDNPASGQSSPRRKAMVNTALATLRQAGVEVEHLTIDGPGSGSQLASHAVNSGCDTVLVCGGDGTAHEILQSLVGTQVALGVLPLGTANALAANLGVPRSPRKAIRALLESTPVSVPVGRISFCGANGSSQSRYFTVAAGIGPDALLMAQMDPLLKRRLGYVLYIIEAFRIWVSHPFPFFEASFRNGSEKPRILNASQILAVRVRSFGGALGRLAPGATLHSSDLSLVAFKTRSRLRYLRFLLAVAAGRHSYSSDVELITAHSVECRPTNGNHANIYVEADGDVLGQLPVRIEMTGEILNLLVPPDAHP